MQSAQQIPPNDLATQRRAIMRVKNSSQERLKPSGVFDVHSSPLPLKTLHMNIYHISLPNTLFLFYSKRLHLQNVGSHGNFC